MIEFTWDSIFEDFKKTYPKLSKDTIHFCPNGVMTIDVYLFDGTKVSYDYLNSRAMVLNERWKD